jgi:uncharacterized membrane protein
MSAQKATRDKATSHGDVRTRAVLLVAVLVLLIASGTMIVRAVKQRNWQQAQLAQAQASDSGRDIRKPMRSLDQMQNYLTVQVYQADQKINDRFNRGEITEEERQRRIQLASHVFTSARDKTVKSNYTVPFDDQQVSRDLQQVVSQGTAPDR